MGYIQSNLLANYNLKFIPFHREVLTWDEIVKVQNLNFKHPTITNVRNIFLFQCFTGLSYAEVSKFSLVHIVVGIDGKSWINMIRGKTNRSFSVPLISPALEIISLYYRVEMDVHLPFFPVLSNQKMNAYLKIIGDAADLTVRLTTHVGRHVFATTITL